MNETLKDIRINALQYSEKDMATKLGMSLSKYKKIENENPISLQHLVTLAQAVGKPIEDLLNMQKQEIKFDIDDAWQTVDELKDKLYEFFKQTYENQEVTDSDFQQLMVSIDKMTRKPRVAFVGRSDVGKSTLINTLIGSKTLPEEWTPTTSIIVYIKHISDKPSYCSSNVMVFKADDSANIWDDTRLAEEEYTKSFCISEGDFSLLRDYGARQGANYNQTNATSAVVFVESDILNNCDLIDLPGYGTKDREEDDSLLKKVQNVDILVYMSVANGFMRGDDINWLQGELPSLAAITLNNKYLKPLANLFIVASQAHTVSNGSTEALKTILLKGAERFEQTLTPNYWDNLGQQASSEDFRKRFFTYSTDQESLRKDFEKDLRNLLLELPVIIKNYVVDFIKNYAKDAKKEIESRLLSFRKILTEREQKKEELKKIEENEPHRIYANEREKTKIKERIEELSQKASVDITTGYNKILTVDKIIQLIEDNKWTKKEEDMKQLSAKLSNLLNDSFSGALRKFSKELNDDINKFLENFENSAKITSTKDNIKVSTSFNFKASFVGGLTGLATFGALSIWAASLGNLGRHILVSRGVSLLASVGISVGGTAAANAAIAAIGGPLVLILSLASMLASFVYMIFSGGWKKSIANKIVKKYDEQNVLHSYLSQNKQYWLDTEKAFMQASTKLENDFEKYISDLREELYNSDDDDINNRIVAEENKIIIFNSLIEKL